MAENHPETISPNGRWPKGRSGNRAGRPRGSRNKTTLALESQLEGAAEQLISKAMEMALNGDIAAMRLCLERILPVRRDRLIQIELPPIGTAGQVSSAVDTVFRAIGEGRITPVEGETITNILVHKMKAMQVEEIESRLEKLECSNEEERAPDHQA